MLDIADGHQLIELLIQCHRLGLSSYNNCNPGGPVGLPREAHRTPRVAIIVTKAYPVVVVQFYQTSHHQIMPYPLFLFFK